MKDEITYSEKNKVELKSPKRKMLEIIISVIILLVFLLLCFLGTKLNIKILNNTNSIYNITNEFSGKFSNDQYDERKDIIKNIGFENYHYELSVINKETYAISTGSHKKYDDDTSDILIVYYDMNNNVNSVTINLIYKKDDFNKNIVSLDANTIISNFINTNISDAVINTLYENKNYYSENSSLSTICFMSNTGSDNDYYSFTFNVSKK